MPKKVVDYSKSIIYKIVCKDPSITDCYVGSTTNLTKRRWQHKFSCNNETDKGYNFYVYKFIREKGGWNNWEMVMIEEYPCDNKMKLCKQERHWIETLKASLNITRPIINKNEKKEYIENYYKDNAIIKKEYQKQYNKYNPDKIKQYNKDNYEKAKEKLGCRICKCIIRRDYFTRHTKSKRHINNL